MTATRNCPLCGVGTLEERTQTSRLEHKGVELEIEGMRYSYCPECESEQTSPDQLDFNAGLVKAAYVRERLIVKAKKSLLTGTAIRGLREMLGLTQQEAARLFGGGPNAFSKYENEDVVQSVSMDRLLRLVAFKPSLMPALADISGETLSLKARDAYVLRSSAETDDALRRELLADASSRELNTREPRAAFADGQTQSVSVNRWESATEKHEPERVASASEQQRPKHVQ